MIALRLAVPAVVLVALLATACAAPARPVTVSLRVSADDGAGHVLRASLSCRGTRASGTGYLSGRARAACRRARRLAGFLAVPPPRNRQCTLVYGGPDTARVRGRIGARAIDRRFARRDGCEISDWERARPLLPASRFAPAPA